MLYLFFVHIPHTYTQVIVALHYYTVERLYCGFFYPIAALLCSTNLIHKKKKETEQNYDSFGTPVPLGTVHVGKKDVIIISPVDSLVCVVSG